VIRLFEEAHRLQERLSERGWPFCFIGGIAVQHWGEPRVTRDLDVSLFTGLGGEVPVIDAMLGMYHGRVQNTKEFALKHRALLLSTPDRVEIDVALASLPFESEIIDRAVSVDMQPGIALRVCNAEDLFVLKAFADRPRDRADLIGIGQRRGASLDWDVIFDRLAPLVEAKDAPEIFDRVRELRAEFERP
jgi:hypothetical protein